MYKRQALTTVKLGTLSFQTWGNGKNTFHRDTECAKLTASGTVTARDLNVQGGNDQSASIVAGSESNDATLFLATPYDPSLSNYSKKCAIIAEGIGTYSKSKLHICLNDDSTNQNGSATVSDSKFSVDRTGQVNIPGNLSVNGTFSNSDASIKTNVRSLNAADALTCLKTVEAKVYDRTDGPKGTRVGYIAQDVQAALPSDWQNVVRSTATEEVTDSNGQVVTPADPGLLQIDYSRMCPILWECCRSMLARIEAPAAAS